MLSRLYVFHFFSIFLFPFQLIATSSGGDQEYLSVVCFPFPVFHYWFSVYIFWLPVSFLFPFLFSVFLGSHSFNWQPAQQVTSSVIRTVLYRVHRFKTLLSLVASVYFFPFFYTFQRFYMLKYYTLEHMEYIFLHQTLLLKIKTCFCVCQLPKPRGRERPSNKAHTGSFYNQNMSHYIFL